MRDNLSLYEKTPLSNPVSVISIPFELGSDARGLAAAPDYLYTHGLNAMLESIGVEKASDLKIKSSSAGEIQFDEDSETGAIKNFGAVAQMAGETASAVEISAKRGDPVLALGGDHSISIGTIRGAATAHESLGVIWIDAHPDVHTHETTISRNAHSMPAALAMGFGHELLLGAQFVKPENFLFVGAKDIDEAELEFLRTASAPIVTMLDIAQRALAPAFAAIDSLSRRVNKIWVSMDIDSIDRAYAPGVAMPSTGGFTAREILSIAQYIGKTCDLAGIDIVEVLPANDVGGKTAALTLELIARFLGGEHNAYSDYMKKYVDAERSNVLL